MTPYAVILLSVFLPFAAFGDGQGQRNASASEGCPVLLKRNSLASNGVLLDDGEGGTSLAVWGQDYPSVAYTMIDTIHALQDYACASTNSFTLVCWGDNTYGQLNVPAALQGHIAAFSVGGHSYSGYTFGWMCAITFDGDMTCWGSNNDGQTNVPSGRKWKSVSIAEGNTCTCGVDISGTLTCWGDGRNFCLNVPSVSFPCRFVSAGVRGGIRFAGFTMTVLLTTYTVGAIMPHLPRGPRDLGSASPSERDYFAPSTAVERWFAGEQTIAKLRIVLWIPFQLLQICGSTCP